jgi:hypothetical protein
MNKKSTYRKLVRRRVEAALRLRISPARRLEPTMDAPDELPAEIIDLASGPFAQRFPALAERSRSRKRRVDPGTDR